MTFRELSDNAYFRRRGFVARRYVCMLHGIGMTDEWPSVRYDSNWDHGGYDGVLEENMTVCVESFTGSDQGGEGVKLEQMVRVTADGCELLTDYPFDERLLGR